jgi:hypothetical protein
MNDTHAAAFCFGTPLLVTRRKNPAAPLSHNAAI